MVATKRKVPLDLRSLILPMNNQCWRMTPGLSASWTETWQFETSRASLFAGRKRSSFNCRFCNNGRHRSKHASRVCSNRSQRSHFCLGMGIPCTSGTSWGQEEPYTCGVARFVGYWMLLRSPGDVALVNSKTPAYQPKAWRNGLIANAPTSGLQDSPSQIYTKRGRGIHSPFPKMKILASQIPNPTPRCMYTFPNLIPHLTCCFYVSSVSQKSSSAPRITQMAPCTLLLDHCSSAIQPPPSTICHTSRH